MALEFNVIKLEWDSGSRRYNAEIEFEGRRAKYGIRCLNGKIYYVDWISKPDMMICDSEDRIACNGDVSIIVEGSDKKTNRRLERALIEFMHSQNE